MSAAFVIGICVLAWMFSGAAIFLHVCYLINPRITVMDMLVSLLAAFVGPCAIVFYLIAAEHIKSPLLSKVIYERKP